MSDEARCTVNVTIHPWCLDPSRDEAVRAAEDGRTCPLPTLEDCIERVFFPFVAAGRAAKKGLADHVAWLTGQKVEPENKGDDMSGSTWFPASEQSAPAPPFADQAKGSPAASETGEGQSGMRTERVTLEITGAPGWTVHVHGCDADTVRVVKEAAPAVHRGSGVFDPNGDEVPWEGVVASLTDERDEAIRERESLREQLESVACRAATAENRVAELESAPAASDAAGTEAVAWGVMVHRDAVLCVPFTVIEAADHFVRLNGVNERMQVVPLYAAPQAASDAAGTERLSAEERNAVAGIALVIDRLKLYPEQLCRTKKDDLDLLWRIAGVPEKEVGRE